MRKTTTCWAAAIVAVLGSAPAQAQPAPADAGAMVHEWNRIVQETAPTPHGVLTPRFFALTHIAMFDAINLFDGAFEPYLAHDVEPAGTPAVAAAQAAHDVLVAINPSAAAIYDAALLQQIGASPTAEARRGAAVGSRVAQRVLEWRRDDGWVVSPFPPYSEPLLPGRWRPTPPTNAPATFTQVLSAKPLAVLSPTQFLPLPPPALTSARYADAVAEVRAIGRSDSTTRTGAQTAVAYLWAGTAASGKGIATNFMSIWNAVARDVARTRGLSPLETARVFALMNVAAHDAVHTAQASKLVYALWRPVTAIREADTDLNPATDPAEPSWLPLLVTPPYSAYAGNMAAIGAGAARALQLVLGTDTVPLTVIWRQSDDQPDVTRQYGGLWALADEQSESRIYGGIHFRFDAEAGQHVGRSVAEFVVGHRLSPRR